MRSIRLGISTQTPLVRPTHAVGNGSHSQAGGSRTVHAPRTLQSQLLHGDAAYHISPGGVTRMILPEIKHWTESGWLQEARWFSLQPHAPPSLKIKDPPVTLHHLSLPKENLQAYARTKEKLWASIHGLDQPTFVAEDFQSFTHYNWFTANALFEHIPDLDLAYIHDFQLLQVGALIGLAAPAVFRWHVPFVAHRIPSYTRNFLVRAMEDYDLVIVSTKRDLEGIHRAGFRGAARQVYPHIDPADWPDVRATEIQAIEHELGLKENQPMILNVGRMDPVKRQDIAIRAHARLIKKHPDAKLVLVGNGSFSGASGKSGGLGINKSAVWAKRLQTLVRELRIEDNVVFAHWINDHRLAAVYARADVVTLTSDLEGFGLTIFEAWRYAKPCVVSRGCGVSELIHDGFDGFLFAPSDEQELAERIDYAVRNEVRREAVGQAARESLAYYDVNKAAPRIRAILQGTIDRYGDH